MKRKKLRLRKQTLRVLSRSATGAARGGIWKAWISPGGTKMPLPIPLPGSECYPNSGCGDCPQSKLDMECPKPIEL